MKLNKEEIVELSVVLWKLWRRKNDFVFKDILTHPKSLLQNAYQLLQDFRGSQQVVTNQLAITNNRFDRWEAPPRDSYKINWDAVVDRVHCKVGIGIVVWDWEGKVLATMRKKQDLFPYSLVA